MPIPSQPVKLIPRPFAANGTYQDIPDTTATPGRASFTAGFPTETQLPLSQGGIAPNRLDFQGLFNLLTAFGFWQQSGGQWTYAPALNYAVPCIVFRDGKLWWCLRENGPDSANGVKTPGASGSDAYWKDLFSAMAAMGGNGDVLSGVPVGTVIMHAAIAAPSGYLPCDGGSFSATTYPKLYTLLGANRTPDMRGLFVRGYDTRNTVDPDGASRAIGSTQGDAIRNMTGYVNGGFEFAAKIEQNGVLYGTVGHRGVDTSYGGQDNDNMRVYFDASRQVPTAAENRPKNINLLYCIKHD